MRKEEVTKLGIVDSNYLHFGHKSFYVNVTDYGKFVRTDYREKDYFLIPENRMKKVESLELDCVTKEFIVKHLERNIKILNEAGNELERILYSTTGGTSPKDFVNLNLANVMVQYFREGYNTKNKDFIDHFIFLYKQLPFDFVNSFPENKHKEISDYLFNPININTEKERKNKKNIVINNRSIIDKNEEYLTGKLLFLKNFKEFLLDESKEKFSELKEIKRKRVLRYLTREIPLAVNQAMNNCQDIFRENEEWHKEADERLKRELF